MDVQHFTEMVSHEAAVTVTGLPPDKKVDIKVFEKTWEEQFREMQKSFQAKDPFKGMTKEETLEDLRKTRKKLCDERHGN